MVTHSPTVGDLLDRADAARAAGRGQTAARLYDEAATRCRAEDDLDGWTQAVLGAASVYLFGSEPGKLPAQLYDVLARTTDDRTRARLAAALARCWAYAGQAGRAIQFADEAVDRAQRAGAPELVADCLDAALAAHWGPDELDMRRSLTTQLDDVAAHVLDPGTRLQAHLWGLQVACEALDVQAIHRQMRALELLGEESARARFFAASRRLMLDLLRGRTDTTAQLTRMAAEAAEQASLADAWMVLKSMDAYSAAQSGDTASCEAGAAECEAFALAEGATAVCAEAAFLWACAGQLDRARALVHTFHGPVLDDLPRDVNWLLTLQCVLEAALDLVGAGMGVAVQSGLGDILDKQALQAYRQRLRDLDQELTEAEQWSDLGRLDALRTERDALLDELARATGLGGRARPAGSSQERARVAVKKAISAATGRIATVDQPLARHLQAGIHTGLNCSYEPDPADSLDWVLDGQTRRDEAGRRSSAQPLQGIHRACRVIDPGRQGRPVTSASPAPSPPTASRAPRSPVTRCSPPMPVTSGQGRLRPRAGSGWVRGREPLRCP